MGCGTSSLAQLGFNDTVDYVPYTGYGTDYTDYGYYQTYFNNQQQPQDWNEYCRQQHYQQSLTPTAPAEEGEDGSGTDAYDQYKKWQQTQPTRQTKPINDEPEKAEGEPIDLHIDNSTNDVKDDTAAVVEKSPSTNDVQQYEDQVDSTAEEPNKRFGLRTLSTALGITIIKHKEVPEVAPGLLQVKVLDTLKSREPDFVQKKPSIPRGSVYIDPDFTKKVALGKYASKYKWKRPHDIVPTGTKICLFHDGTSLDDIDQGSFGTCYFLATLSGLATLPNVMKQIIMPDAYNPKTGVFHWRFWRLGQWIDIYTDDFLPCDEDSLVGCKSNNYAGEMWVPLIEKAYAKFIGSYPRIEGGTPRDAYLALTGGCAEWLALSFYKFDPVEVYSRIANALQHGSVVVCSATPKDKQVELKYQDLGLVLNHAYTITATAVVERKTGKSVSLVKLRNPWSHKEWSGAWGDKSSEWYSISDAQRNQLRIIEDNGEFWMPWTEYWKIFTDLTICSITPDYDSDGISDGLDHVFCIYGQWKGNLTGGWENLDMNPIFECCIPETAQEPCLIMIEKIQKLADKVEKATAGNILLKDLQVEKGEEEMIGKDTLTYTTSNPMVRRFEVKPGGKYRIIPAKFRKGVEGQFLLRVFSKQPLDIRAVKVYRPPKKA